MILGINTVGDVCEAALLGGDGAFVARLSEPMSQGHDARLAPLVDELLRGARVSPKQLIRIAVAAGPGSFTGVRVGVSFARGLALATGAAAVGVTSLEAIETMPPRGRVLGLLPAKRRPPERSWWAQVVLEGRGEGEPVEADEARIVELGQDCFALCGGLDGIPDIGLKRIEACVSAEAAARFAVGLDGDLPPARPIYARAPDAVPSVRP
jgi:tRNA threonylcarbamoyladenosine biosynthesis protein TsaB